MSKGGREGKLSSEASPLPFHANPATDTGSVEECVWKGEVIRLHVVYEIEGKGGGVIERNIEHSLALIVSAFMICSWAGTLHYVIDIPMYTLDILSYVSFPTLQ